MITMRCMLVAAVAIATTAHAQLGATLEINDGISPRYFLGSPPQLAKRQSGACPSANQHSCQDINSPTLCCDNDHYCFIDTTGNPGCCAIGNNCNPSCSLDQYQCNSTTTVSGVATTTSACCPRPCTASIQFQCAPQFGGNCCQLGFACATSSCVSTAPPATTLVTQVPSGCTTGQFSCASSIGGGCCNNGAVCTSSVSASSTLFLCASNTSPPSAIPTSAIKVSSGLSPGAKAGIGVGIGLGACLIIGLITWFCIRQRRAARQSQIDQQTASVSGTGTQVVSEGSKRPPRARGQSDYFGPDAAAGPYTGTQVSPSQTPSRGVPLSPDAPGDIVPPVEIGDSRNHSNVTSPALLTPDIKKDIPETPENRQELP